MPTSGKRVLALVLARGGSTRCPGKNGAMLGQKPMIRWAAEAVLAARCVTKAYVSTDSEELAAAAGLPWIRQPGAISTATSTIEQAVAHGLLYAENQARADGATRPEFDYVVVLQCAVPVRPAGAIDALVQAVDEGYAGGGVTVVPRTPWMWRVYGDPQAKVEQETALTWWHPRRYPRSQDVAHKTLEEINSIQVTPRRMAIQHRRHEFPMVLLELPRWADLDVDTLEDLAHAKAMWPAIEPMMGTEQKYASHVVRHQWRPPSTRYPIQVSWGEALTGVVIGNSPSIDSLPAEVWQALSSPELITLGLNRLCCSLTAQKHNFAPTLHLVWDQWPEATRQQMNAGLARLQGRTWRLSSQDSASVLEHDQVVGNSPDHFGPPTELHMRFASADGAANLLYRLGCRRIYFLGCDFKPGCTGKRCLVPWEEFQGSVGVENWQMSQLDALRDVAAYPGLQMYSCHQDTSLVSSGLMPYGWPEGVKSAAVRAAS